MTSASGGAAPADATFVTLSVNATLTNERVLTGTANQITITDNGAGSTVVLSLPQSIATSSTPTFASLTLTAASSLTLGTASTNTGQIILRNSTNANTLTLQAGATGGNITFTLPTDDGDNGEVLTTNGSGVLSWEASGGSGTVTDVSVVTANGVSGSVATSTTTPAITLTLGAITPTTVNGNTITTGTGTLTLGAGKTLTASNTLTFTGTDGSSVAFGTGGTVLYTASAIPLTVGTTTIASGNDTRVLFNNAGVLGQYVISGSGNVAMTTSPVFTTPNIGAATATSVNGLTITSSTGTFTLTNAKTLAVTNTLTLSGTDSTVMTFPTTSATIARTDAGQTFTGVNTFTSPSITTSLTTGSSSFDLLNATATTINFAGASGSVVNLGGGANAAELRFLEPSGGGTSYVALKSPALGGNVTLTLPNSDGDSGQVLTTDGSGVTSWATPSSGASPSCLISLNWEASSRYNNTGTSSGTNTFNTVGIDQDTTATGGRSAAIVYTVNATQALWATSSTFSTVVGCTAVPGSDGPEAYYGVGLITTAGTGHTFTEDHYGFKIKKVAGAFNLYGTNADGTTESVTGVLTTVASGDLLRLIAVFTLGASVAYYYSKNFAAWSSATTVTTNLPRNSATNSSILQTSVSNASVASQIRMSNSHMTLQASV